MFEKLDAIKKRFDEINQEMTDPASLSNMKAYQELVRERSSLEEIANTYQKYLDVVEQLKEARELLEQEEDHEMKEFLKGEVETFEKQSGETEGLLRTLLIPKDEFEGKDIIMEIRAGTGGDEAALFAGDLFRMYMRYAERNRWKTELLSSSPSEMGGFKEIIFSVKGKSVYPLMKFESGVHRVQRVPATESGGRIHTSTATTAVLPEAEGVEISIDPSDLKVDVFRSTGPGGQSVNTTDSAVRITHLPSGTTVSCQDEKSQLQNKEKALRILKARILEAARREQEEAEAETRRKQVGTGERSEKIRTYNFPQGRVTDHRIGLTLHRLSDVLEGDLDEITEALLEDQRMRALKEMDFS